MEPDSVFRFYLLVCGLLVFGWRIFHSISSPPRRGWGRARDLATTWFCAAVFCGLFALGSAVYSTWWLLASKPVTGEIIEVHEIPRTRGTPSFSIEYQYPDSNGTIRENSIPGTGSEKSGDSLPLRCLVAFPHLSRPDTFEEFWSMPLVVCVPGGLLLLLGFAARYAAK